MKLGLGIGGQTSTRWSPKRRRWRLLREGSTSFNGDLYRVNAPLERAGDRRRVTDRRHQRRRRREAGRREDVRDLLGLPSYRAMLDAEGAAGPADVAIVGDETEVAAGVQALADAGVTEFNASCFGDGDTIRRTTTLLKELR